MMNKKLTALAGSSIKYTYLQVLCQWVALLCNITMVFSFAMLLQKLSEERHSVKDFAITLVILTVVLLIRYYCTVISARLSAYSSEHVKKKLRSSIFNKLVKLGASYHEKVTTSEAVQVSVEGVEQLEVYFGRYLPQLFYSILAPLTLFFVLAPVSLSAAAVLLVCVPLIPISIIAIQKIAKKLFIKYWGEYTTLGDSFLENLQGLTALKIYQADELKNKQMNEQAERFRKITMKVLTMQLNSVTVMDLIAYGGAATGVILAVTEFTKGNIELGGCLAIILLSAEFFIPLRLLGSYFHIATNGMAAGEKILSLLEQPEESQRTQTLTDRSVGISCRELKFSYDRERDVLHGMRLDFPQGSFTALVGESGSGKSTVAALITGSLQNYCGSIRMNGLELRDITEESLMKSISLISHDSYLFNGTVRENLRVGNPIATDREMLGAIECVRLDDFLKGEAGLDTFLSEKASNLSGGQRQRLALARALLHNSAIYIFDEATSNIDSESENYIIDMIHKLAQHKKTVILISHRLVNVMNADRIYVLSQGRVVESGNHMSLLENDGIYKELWHKQQALECFLKREVGV